MRQLTPTLLTTINQKTGTEPRIVVEVDWGGGPVSYDPLQVSPIESTVDIASSSSSQAGIVLDDTSGEIRAIMNGTHVQKRPARVYQMFAGSDERFLLLSGKVESPVWSETDRTFSFTLLSIIEDREFGFSAEEGEFEHVPQDLIGKPWPVIFGTVRDYPALRVNKAVSGSTLSGLGILSGRQLQESVPLGGTDCSAGMALAMMAEQVSLYSIAGDQWAAVDAAKAAQFRNQANAIQAQMTTGIDVVASQQACGANVRMRVLDAAEANGLGPNPVRILGGEDFRQDTPITLSINGGLFTGIMRGDWFTISTRRHPDDEARAQVAFDRIATCPMPTATQFYNLEIDAPGGPVRRNGFVVCNTPQAARPSIEQVAQHFWAEPGSRVMMASDEPISYIASITPGKVLTVKAYKKIGGEERLVNVPNDLWRVRTENYDAITATIVETVRPLTSIINQGWVNDELYLTYESYIGPNTVHILKWIIERYSELAPDATSFNTLLDKLEPFPMNFPVLKRINTLALLKQIAYQARCAFTISNGVIYLKYLPDVPESVQTITVSNIESGSVEVIHDEADYTKLIANWRLTWDKDPDKIILRNNIDKYGMKVEEQDFFCFNQPDIAMKMATFHLIRQSNAYKRLKFRGFLDLLRLEPFDTVTLAAR